MLRIIALLPIFVLAGCLTTKTQVFTLQNSIPAGESQLFMQVVEAWERHGKPQDSPREIAEKGERVVETAGIVIIQETKRNGTFEFYAVGMMGDRPMACFAHDAQVEPIAARHGVDVTIDRDDDADQIAPAPMQADGDAASLYPFIMDVFGSGTLSCFTPPHEEA
ncbi:MAG: hypothetical protein AAF666_07395 [Pseudomonadota bacterium]